jgi:hypothetical protein
VVQEHGRSLVKKLAGKPFVIVGVNSDFNRDRVKTQSAKEKITWRSFWDGGSAHGPISTRWNIHGWPEVYLIDHNGVIVRYDWADEKAEQLIVQKVKEAEAALKGK